MDFFSQNAWKNSLTKFLGMEISLWETFNYRFNSFVDVELLLNSVSFCKLWCFENYENFDSSTEVSLT